MKQGDSSTTADDSVVRMRGMTVVPENWKEKRKSRKRIYDFIV